MAKPANIGTMAAARVRSTRPTSRSGSDPAAPGPRRIGSFSQKKWHQQQHGRTDDDERRLPGCQA